MCLKIFAFRKLPLVLRPLGFVTEPLQVPSSFLVESQAGQRREVLDLFDAMLAQGIEVRRQAVVHLWSSYGTGGSGESVVDHTLFVDSKPYPWATCHAGRPCSKDEATNCEANASLAQ